MDHHRSVQQAVAKLPSRGKGQALGNAGQFLDQMIYDFSARRDV